MKSVKKPGPGGLVFYFGERSPGMCLEKNISFMFTMLICIVCFLSGFCSATVHVIGPEDHSVYLDQRDPDLNFVSKRGLLVVSELNENARAVIHFDLDGWSVDSISEAKLCLYKYRGDYFSVSRTINVHPLTTAFNESTATWNYPWTVPGGDFDNSISASAEVPELPEDVVARVEWDVTEMVTSRWSDLADCGFLIKDPVEDTPSSSGPYVRFRSHRYFDEKPLELACLEITTLGTGVEDADHDFVSRSFRLGQNFPNPFNHETLIEFSLVRSAQVSLVIYNIRGEKVKTLMDKEKPAGAYTLKWDGTNQSGEPVASGIYLYQLRTESFSETKRLLFLK
jgi:hypothetical protein